MRLLSLDLSTSTGWALLVTEEGSDNPRLVDCGRIVLGDTAHGYGGYRYPWDLLAAVETIALGILKVVEEVTPDRIVIEETNGGGRANRYSQKILEFLHLEVLRKLQGRVQAQVDYINSSEWRRVLDIKVDNEHRKLNAKLSRAKSKAKTSGERLDKKSLGIRGRYTIKHATLDFINARFGLALKVGENDIADAVAVGLSAFRGALPCDGT